MQKLNLNFLISESVSINNESKGNKMFEEQTQWNPSNLPKSCSPTIDNLENPNQQKPKKDKTLSSNVNFDDDDDNIKKLSDNKFEDNLTIHN